MQQRMQLFLQQIATDTYPEAPSQIHTQLTTEAIDYLFTNYGLMRGALVLDVGCGQGVALKLFSERGCRPVGITLNLTDLEECSRQGYTVTQMDQSFLDFDDATFDLVWARHVVEHSIAPYFTLMEFARVLKPGGLLYLEVPGIETTFKHELNKNHYSLLSNTMWLSLMERSGIPAIEAQKYHLEHNAGPDEYWAFFGKKLHVTPSQAQSLSC